jgi:beta-glucosidase
VIDNWSDHAIATETKMLQLEARRSYDIRFEYYEAGGQALVRLGWAQPGENLINEAVSLARESDVAIVVAGLSSRFESENMDRDGLELPGRQDELIQAVCHANPRTIVVLINGTPVLMSPWMDHVPAIVEAWYPGQEGGQAVSDVLFGRVNPSGKLPATLPNSWEQCPAYGHYPGKDGEVRYQEGIFVGYRHFDSRNLEPAYPFGHGLSYTEFEYSGLRIEPVRVPAGQNVGVSLTVKNVGRREGKEVVQLYLRDVDSTLARPTKELKGFRKVSLKANESTLISFELDREAMSFFDDRQGQWVAEPGRFEVLLGGSSRDIRLTGEFWID